MITYYKTDNRNLSWTECWRFGKGFALPLLCFCKVFRVPLNLDKGLPFPIRAADVRLEEDALPTRVRAVFHAPLRDLQSLGFRVMWFGELRTTLQPTQMHLAELLHEAGEVAARVVHLRTVAGVGAMEMLITPLITGFHNGRVLVTSNMSRSFDPPPFVSGQSHVGALPAKLWSLHAATLEKARVKEMPRRLRLPAEYEQFIDDYEYRCSEHNIRRRLYVEMSAPEVEVARRRRESLFAPAPPPRPAPLQE